LFGEKKKCNEKEGRNVETLKKGVSLTVVSFFSKKKEQVKMEMEKVKQQPFLSEQDALDKFPDVPSAEPHVQSEENTKQNQQIEKTEEVGDLIPTESASHCSSEDEEGVVSEILNSQRQYDEKTDKVNNIKEEEEEEESLEYDDEFTEEIPEQIIRHVTLVPVECNTEKEDIKICCICNNIVSQHKKSEEEEEESGSDVERKGNPDSVRKSFISGQNPYTEFPRCGCVTHFACLIHSRWVRNNNSKKSVICPSCSEPKPLFTLEETRNHVRTMDQYKPSVKVGIPDDAEKKKIVQSLIQLLYNTGRHTEALSYSTRLKSDFTGVWNYIKNEKVVKFDDFMKLGWDMSHVYNYITKDFTELCNKYEFNLDHLSHEQTAIGLAINYEITAADLKTKFQKEFTLKKLASLDMTPLAMMVLGMNTHQLCLLGMKKDGIKHFQKLSMRDWVKMLNFSKEHLHILGIRKEDFSNPKVLGNSYGECLNRNGKYHHSHTSSVQLRKGKGEGVLWSVEGLRDLLDLTNEELLKYKLASPKDLKGGTSRYHPNDYHPSRRGHSVHKGRRKPLKERRRRRIKRGLPSASGKNDGSVVHSTDSLLRGLREIDNQIIPPPTLQYNSKKENSGMGMSRKMPEFAPLTKSEKESIAQLKAISEGVGLK